MLLQVKLTGSELQAQCCAVSVLCMTFQYKSGHFAGPILCRQDLTCHAGAGSMTMARGRGYRGTPSKTTTMLQFASLNAEHPPLHHWLHPYLPTRPHGNPDVSCMILPCMHTDDSS